MRRNGVVVLAAVGVFAVLVGIVSLSLIFVRVSKDAPKDAPPPVTAAELAYTFNSPGVLNEAANDANTTSPYWWLSSGGELIIANGIGKTVQGALPSPHRWRLAYAASNPLDTDNGYYPQNLFRLVSRESWSNPVVEASFRIVRDNLSASPNRNESNGLFLMSRYQDQYTLYYAGVRVDGYAVIKKKYHGTYYTLAVKKIFPGTYDRGSAPDLLPHNEWLDLRSETTTNRGGTVSITLSMRLTGESAWTTLVVAEDDGTHFGGPAIVGSAQVGLRTDFMDVEFDDIRANEAQ